MLRGSRRGQRSAQPLTASILARPGRRGPVGDTGPRGRKGERGARGENASTIIAWTLDTKNYRAIPTMSNGRAGAPLDLRPLFEQFCEEAIAPAVAAALTAALKDAARNPNLFAPL